MRAIIQRVTEASVTVEQHIVGKIGHGLLVLLGIEDSDNDEDVRWLAGKIVNLRIFNDAKGIMNHNVIEMKGDILLISQFTLFANTKKGNRPSYIRASKPDFAIPVYEKVLTTLEEISGKPVQKGKFGADMKVALVNDGPVTIFIDTKERG